MTTHTTIPATQDEVDKYFQGNDLTEHTYEISHYSGADNRISWPDTWIVCNEDGPVGFCSGDVDRQEAPGSSIIEKT